MKLGRKRNVLIILISACFTCLICLGFSKNPENIKQEAIAKVHKISKYDFSLSVNRLEYISYNDNKYSLSFIRTP